MSKKMIIQEFSAAFNNKMTKENISKNDLKGYYVVGKKVQCKFNVFSDKIKIEVTYTKDTIEELEAVLINFLS